MDKTIDMAREAGFTEREAHKNHGRIERLIALVRADEREQEAITAITAFKQALAAPANLWLYWKVNDRGVVTGPIKTASEDEAYGPDCIDQTLLAAQRQWVGLTDEDKLHIEIMGGKSDVMLAELVEAKLKEKNT